MPFCTKPSYNPFYMCLYCEENVWNDIVIKLLTFILKFLIYYFKYSLNILLVRYNLSYANTSKNVLYLHILMSEKTLSRMCYLKPEKSECEIFYIKNEIFLYFYILFILQQLLKLTQIFWYFYTKCNCNMQCIEQF